LLALIATVAIVGIGAVVSQTQQESPANAVEKVVTATTQTVPATTPTQSDVNLASQTPAAGSASIERTNPNPLLNNESDSNPASSQNPSLAPSATSVKNPSIGVMPTNGGEYEDGAHHKDGEHNGEGEDD